MLRFIEADDRDIWVKVGGIIKDEFGDSGYSLWTDWSQSSDRYIEKDAAAVWKSLGKNSKRAGIGSIVHLARQRGWTPHGSAPEPAPKRRPAPTPRCDTGAYAPRLWLAARFGDEEVQWHHYADKKGIQGAGGARRGIASGKIIGRDADCLIVPIRTDASGKLQGVQCINASGDKQTFGRIIGGCLVL